MKVLVVEDNEKFRNELRSLITNLDHEVVVAEDGRQAVELLYKDGDTLDPSFNAVITDMRMPNMSGLKLLQFLNERRATLPCLLHSTDPTGGGINLSDIEGAFDFVTFFHLKGSVAYIKQFLTLANQNKGLR